MGDLVDIPRCESHCGPANRNERFRRRDRKNPIQNNWMPCTAGGGPFQHQRYATTITPKRQIAPQDMDQWRTKRHRRQMKARTALRADSDHTKGSQQNQNGDGVRTQPDEGVRHHGKRQHQNRASEHPVRCGKSECVNEIANSRESFRDRC